MPPADEAVPAADVLRVITRLNIGGPARHVQLLTRGLADRWPTLLAAGDPPPHEGELRDPDVAVHRVPLVRQVRPLTDARAVAAIRHLLGATGARLLHTHTAKAGTAGRLAARSLRRRHRPVTVHTFHGHVLEGYFPGPVERAFVGVERLLARQTDALVAVSEEVRDDLLGLGIGRPDQWHVVPLGLDLDRHLEVAGPDGRLRRQLGLGPDVPLAGIVGRLAPIKDVGTTLRAVARLPDVHLAVIGDGEVRTALEEEAASLGMAARVHFTGWLRDIPPLMADLDVVVLSSLNEGTPVALIEASACARPVVATDVGGVRAVVSDGATGTLVAAGDDVALAEAVAAALADPADAAERGRRGRAHVRQRFSQERLVADVDRLYRSLLP